MSIQGKTDSIQKSKINNLIGKACPGGECDIRERGTAWGKGSASSRGVSVWPRTRAVLVKSSI